MSYILEALKRAEAERERERGAVPGLNAQPMAGTEPIDAPRWLRPVLWAGGGALMVLAGLVAWRWQGPGPAAPASWPGAGQMAMVSGAAPAPQAATPGPVLAAQAPAPMPVTPGPRAPAPVAAPAVIGSATPAVAEPQPVPVSRAPVRPAPQFAAPPAGPARTVPAPGRQAPTPVSPAPVQAAGPSPGAPPAGDDRVYASASELPGDARGGVPPLAIGGSIYSPDPAARFIIINGQVLHEGDEVANGLKLERIELKSAVLNYRGYRFRVGY